MNLEIEYNHACISPSDINEHVRTLYELAKGCSVVVEMGTRSGVSTLGLLMAQPKKLLCIDKSHMSHVIQNLESMKGVTELECISADTLEYTIPSCDLLFIDTYHTYDQLRAELARHGNKAKKYIAFHDTVTFGRSGEDGGGKGLMDAIEEFLEQNKQWKIKHHYENNNGLLILHKSALKK